MNLSLNDWLKNGWLIEHKTSPQEIEDLFRIVDRDLKDCEAALAAAGYRTSRESHHYRVIQSLVFTIGSDARLVRQFDQFRKKRNISVYEMAGLVSEAEAEEMKELAGELMELVRVWLKNNYPQLLPD